MSDTVWAQLSGKHCQIPTFPCTGIRVVGAFKSKLKKVSAQALIHFSLATKTFAHEFLVIPDLSYPIIIGIDFLRLHNARLEIKNKIFYLTFENEDGFAIKEVDFSHEFAMHPPLNISRIINGSDSSFKHTPSQEVFSNCTVSFDDICDVCPIPNFEKMKLRELLNAYKNIFSNIPGRTTFYTHTINLKNETDFFIKPYPIPVVHRDVVNRALQQMIEWGVIERASSSYISPLMTTVKKDGSVRICLDARHLNSVMEADWELPWKIEYLIKLAHGKKYFSKIDLSHSYWQIPVREQDRKFLGFMVGNRTYQWCVLPFGVSTAVSSFTRAMDTIFGEAFAGFMLSYIDDLFIMSESLAEHLEHLEKIFCRLQEAGLTVKLSKCQFFQQEINFLGYRITQEGVLPDLERIQAIVDYKTPRSIKEIQKFLGLCNYDRVFTPRFAELSAPLTQLLRKQQSWRWGPMEEDAFQSLKNELKEATLLYHPNFDIPFHVATDASDQGIAGQLYQLVKGKKQVVAWASRLLLPRERNYHSNEKEVLAALWCCQRWRTYLLANPFTIHTDNRALTYLNTCRLLSPRITRWALALQEFSYSVQHMPGKENVEVDALSRYACVRLPTPLDKCFQIFSLKLPLAVIKLLKNIKIFQSEDNKFSKIITELTEKPNSNSHFILHNDIIYKRGSDAQNFQLCIPKNMIKDIVIAFHESIGHFGTYKTFLAIKNEIYFENMHRNIKKFIKSCQICQKAKISILPKPPQSQIIPTSKSDLIAIDTLGPLVKSRGGMTYIFVIYNVFTKHVTLYPLKKITAKSLLNRLFKDYFAKNDPVNKILSDNATQFTSKVWKETITQHGMRPIYVSVRHPAANPSERAIREVSRIIRTYCHDKHSRWAVDIKLFENFLNSVVHESTGFSPNELQYGNEPVKFLPAKLSFPAKAPLSLDEKLILAEATLKTKAERRAVTHPGRPYQSFQTGELVLLRANNLSSAIKAETKKLLLLFEGPFRIKKVIRDHTYLLEFIKFQKERGIFHASHLKRYHHPP